MENQISDLYKKIDVLQSKLPNIEKGSLQAEKTSLLIKAYQKTIKEIQKRNQRFY